MTTKTRRELVDQALSNLGVLVPGNVPSDEDVSTVDSHVVSVVESIESREIASIGNLNAIEAKFFLPLAVILADSCKYEFGGGEFDVMGAEQQLRHMSRSGPTYETLQVQYF